MSLWSQPPWTCQVAQITWAPTMAHGQEVGTHLGTHYDTWMCTVSILWWRLLTARFCHFILLHTTTANRTQTVWLTVRRVGTTLVPRVLVNSGYSTTSVDADKLPELERGGSWERSREERRGWEEFVIWAVGSRENNCSGEQEPAGGDDHTENGVQSLCSPEHHGRENRMLVSPDV